MFNQPAPTREPGQRSLDYPLYISRYVPLWSTPEWILAERWRQIVRNQPIAMICRDKLIAMILALDWKIEARDSNQRDELKGEIEYYTQLIEDSGDLEYTEHVEWIGQDLLDLPFGGAAELIRENDDPEGRVLTIIPLDGGTLFPTLSADQPVGQRTDLNLLDPVYFPYYAIDRISMSPRPEMKREGWSMAPPEKIYLAVESLNRGDSYYANLLLDTPGAGILDLGDMEKESAEQWVDSLRALLAGIDPFKIPVLYEHTSEAKFIPFGKVPNDLMYDRIFLFKASITASGYGITLSDIGIPQGSNGGDTLAGSIRQERNTRRTGFGTVKRKFIGYFNRLLPKTLKFRFIDYDEELNVAKGRALLASTQAYGTAIDKRIFTPKEARLQMISDGLITISMPEDVDEKEFDILQSGQPTPKPDNLLGGNPVAPSQGGQGEKTTVTKSATESHLSNILRRAFNELSAKADDVVIKRLVRAVAPSIFEQVRTAVVHLADHQEVDLWARWHNSVMLGEIEDVPEVVTKALSDAYDEADKPLNEDDWWNFDISRAEIATILSLAYLDSLKSSAQELIDTLYENGYLPSRTLDPNMAFKLTNYTVSQYLEQKAASMVSNINDGTRYYLRRMLIAGVRDGLTQPQIVAKIRAGIDLEEILGDNMFMQSVLQQIKSDLVALSDYRIDSIVGFELKAAQNQARIDQFKRVGLDTKKWNHNGSDQPCQNCSENEALGFVPLDFEYDTPLGTSKAPPGHPHEHCDLSFNKAELFSLSKQGKFTIWTGD